MLSEHLEVSGPFQQDLGLVLKDDKSFQDIIPRVINNETLLLFRETSVNCYVIKTPLNIFFFFFCGGGGKREGYRKHKNTLVREFKSQNPCSFQNRRHFSRLGLYKRDLFVFFAGCNMENLALKGFSGAVLLWENQ